MSADPSKANIETPIGDDEWITHLRGEFEKRYPIDPQQPFFLIKVPLRLAPLGAHSDHQGGTVTGFAIDRSIRLLGQVSMEPRISVASVTFSGDAVVDCNAVPEPEPGDWRNYLRGAVRALQNLTGGLGRGLTGVVHGSMPIGGLSSSAAVTLAYLSALQQANHLQLSSLELIMLVRAVENGYLGLHNGILDQSVIVSSTRGALTVIDCATHRRDSIPVGESRVPWEIMVVYSGLSRQLTSTPFNQRVAECHEAARELLTLVGKPVGERPLLSQITREEWLEYEGRLSATSRQRARHFFTEADRVKRGRDAWAAGDMEGFGKLVTESGHSSIVNYESGSPVLISLYEILSHTTGVLGTRFCGGGFQGCALALIDSRRRADIAEQLRERYTGLHPELIHDYSIHMCETSDGISVVEVP